ncbi:hypothetical protein BB560_001973 [Smittium megazygosporum]|uniref:HAD phosphatase, family IIIA n=1 Tax=Smittium megazygosporum TaxID=133381 RepID=A0A2T9ZG21_9FUNG|nr:hypothetical protein BB560_001973 [Smittium megazygosporum]
MDNTLGKPYESQVHVEYEDVVWPKIKKLFGIERLLVVSNSAGVESDDKGYLKAAEIEKSLGIKVLRHKEKKPLGGEIMYEYFATVFENNQQCKTEILKRTDQSQDPALLQRNQIAFIGDRLLTDVVFGNKNGFYTIYLTQPICTKNDNTAAKIVRKLEHFYSKAFL